MRRGILERRYYIPLPPSEGGIMRRGILERRENIPLAP
jgi:hypothetical protein